MISKYRPLYNGTIITIPASNPFNSGEYFAINNRGIFGSTDFGVS
jgi:hypothetical protein